MPLLITNPNPITIMNYAGFWKRFVAIIIDAILLGCLQWLVLTPILTSMGFISDVADMANGDGDPFALMTKLIALMSVSSMIGWVVNILYFSFMESSKYQATIGKLALGIVVTDISGQKLDFVKALIRNISKIVSSFILFIGYIMAGFTEKKQALHDMIAGTLVVNK